MVALGNLRWLDGFDVDDFDDAFDVLPARCVPVLQYACVQLQRKSSANPRAALKVAMDCLLEGGLRPKDEKRVVSAIGKLARKLPPDGRLWPREIVNQAIAAISQIKGASSAALQQAILDLVLCLMRDRALRRLNPISRRDALDALHQARMRPSAHRLLVAQRRLRAVLTP